MKYFPLLTLLVVSTLTPALAITDADLTTVALAGKTLTFTIVNGTSPFATTGTWTGTFAAAGGSGFTVANVTGNTVNIASTQTGTMTGVGFTEISLNKFIEGRASAVLTLNYSATGVGGYEVFINGLFGASVNGTFTIGTAVPPVASEIGIQQPAGTNLADGMAQKSFGKVKVGKSAAAKIFTIQNTGSANLAGLTLTKSGANKADFILTKLTKSSLSPATRTTFSVIFKPKSKGAKTAVIRVGSNDADEGSFEINLTGKGTP
jgi:Abnormal spindle-like microcephaly-assoc'd, ASPM-SPD-2-Hydin